MDAKPVSRGDDVKTIVVPSKRESGASSRMIKDSSSKEFVFFLKIIFYLI